LFQINDRAAAPSPTHRRARRRRDLADAKGEPTKVHHLARDAEFLIELPERIEIHRLLIDERGLR